MKAITLHQPWATFMAVGLKKIETRSWAPPPRLSGWVAIHAGKTAYDHDYTEELMRAAVDEMGDAYEARLDEIDPWPKWDRLPLGAIVGVGNLLGARRTEDLVNQRLGPDRPLGNYEPGRYGWMFGEIIRCPTPLPCRGYQKLWDVPVDVEAELQALIERWALVNEGA